MKGRLNIKAKLSIGVASVAILGIATYVIWPRPALIVADSQGENARPEEGETPGQQVNVADTQSTHTPRAPGADQPPAVPPLQRARETALTPEIAYGACKLPLYSAEPHNPFGAAKRAWNYPVPLFIKDANYNAKDRTLRLTIAFVFPDSAITAAKTQLAKLYRKQPGGGGLEHYDLTLGPLELKGYDLVLSLAGSEIKVKGTQKPNSADAVNPPGELVFPVSLAEYKLSDSDRARFDAALREHMSDIQLIFRAYYEVNYQSALIVDAREIQGAIHDIIETSKPPSNKSRDSFLFFRDSTDKVKTFLSRQFSLQIKSWGLDKEDRERRLDRLGRVALDRLDSLPPIKFEELWRYAKTELVFGNGTLKAGSEASVLSSVIKHSKDLSVNASKVHSIVHTLSDLANDKSVTNEELHKRAGEIMTRVAVDTSGSAYFGALEAKLKADMQSDKKWDDTDQARVASFKKNRQLLKNEKEYEQSVYDKHYQEIEGDVRKFDTTAKTLEFVRVSSADLSGYTGSKIVETEPQRVTLAKYVQQFSLRKAFLFDVRLSTRLEEDIRQLNAWAQELEIDRLAPAPRARVGGEEQLQAFEDRLAHAQRKADEEISSLLGPDEIPGPESVPNLQRDALAARVEAASQSLRLLDRKMAPLRKHLN